MDTTLILEGLQGIGKTSFFRILADVAPRAFGGNPPRDVGSQAMKEFICGPWIVEFGELASFRRSELEDVKTFLTNLEDRFRPAYGRTVVSFPRRCVFAATTNGLTYFRDTENRRYLPVACTQIDFAGLTRDRDQIWGEAVHWYDQGESWDLTPEEKALARVEQGQRYEIDALEPSIAHALTHGVRAEGFTFNATGMGQWAIQPNAPSITVREVLEFVCKDRGDRSIAMQARVSTILGARMGWDLRTDERGERRYYRPVPPIVVVRG